MELESIATPIFHHLYVLYIKVLTKFQTHSFNGLHFKLSAISYIKR